MGDGMKVGGRKVFELGVVQASKKGGGPRSCDVILRLFDACCGVCGIAASCHSCESCQGYSHAG